MEIVAKRRFDKEKPYPLPANYEYEVSACPKTSDI